MEAALRGVSYAKAVVDNCRETGLPDGTRVFISDMYFPEDDRVTGVGENCVLHAHGDPDVTGLTTLNSAWWPIHVVGVKPAPFFVRGRTFSVPTLHLVGPAKLAGREMPVLQLGLQDYRYGVVLCPNTSSVVSIEHALDEILSQPVNVFAGGWQVVDLQIPAFIVRSDTRRDDRSTGSSRAVKFVAQLDFNQSGVGSPSNWPPLPHGILWNVSSAPPVSIVLNRPFYFAIVRYDTQSLLFAGYIAMPMSVRS
jgi:hypothetical protein